MACQSLSVAQLSPLLSSVLLSQSAVTAAAQLAGVLVQAQGDQQDSLKLQRLHSGMFGSKHLGWTGEENWCHSNKLCLQARRSLAQAI